VGLVVTRWRKYGQERLQVNEGGAEDPVGHYDCKTGRLQLTEGHEDRGYEVMEALRPFLGRTVPKSLRDLMPEAPLAAPSNPPRSRTGKGERIVEKRLGRLRRDGWTVLSSIVKRSGADIDHLVIGPPGVFTINTKHHRDASIWVGENMVKVDNARQPHYLSNSRHEAASAARVLSDAVGLDVIVTPVLAFVGAASINARDSSGDVMITTGEAIEHALLEKHAVYSIQERGRIFAVARRAEIWLA
jgi:Nuclease-related domain